MTGKHMPSTKGIPTKCVKHGNNFASVILGNVALPHNKVTSWSIKILNSVYSNGDSICIGVVPSDINQNKNYNKCG